MDNKQYSSITAAVSQHWEVPLASPRSSSPEVVGLFILGNRSEHVWCDVIICYFVYFNSFYVV